LTPVDGRKWENPLNRGDWGENPSAKGRLPDVYLLTKIPLIYCLIVFYLKKLQKVKTEISSVMSIFHIFWE
jgi:hypothetical protein